MLYFNKLEELHFYYNREKRLEKASERVRALYDTSKQKKTTFFSSLTDSKPKAAMFTVIVMMSLLILFVTYLLPAGSTGTVLGGNSITMEAASGGGTTFIVLRKEAKNKKSYTGIVNVNAIEQSKVYNHGLVFTGAQTEEFRWSLPYEAKEIFFFLQTASESISFRVASKALSQAH